MGKYNKIYVLATYNFATGGVELAHQLVDYLRHKSQEAFIVYVNDGEIETKELSVTSAYSKYDIAVSPVIEDSPKNILVIPEVFFEFVLKYKFIQIGCWWMSVDNRYNNISYPEFLKHRKSIYLKIRVMLSHYLLGHYNNIKNSTKDLIENKDRITHFYQSHYAYEHVTSLGLTKLLPLSDYINPELITEGRVEKEDIILYNPAKGLEFTKKIIKKMPGCRFIALKGLSRQELSILLSKAKLYIDFGHFPGKDRLPREAVMNGCCILTGRNGASQYFEDVPIKDEYKFDTKNSSIKYVISKIKYILTNYEMCKADFNEYRKIVSNEKKLFFKEIDDIFL